MNKASQIEIRPARRARAWALVGMVLGLGLLGCGTSGEAATDTKTNWLSRCERDAECGGGLSCLCGVCSLSCDGNSECSSVGARAECLQIEGCQEEVTICALPESSDTDEEGTEPEETEPVESGTSESEPDVTLTDDDSGSASESEAGVGDPTADQTEESESSDPDATDVDGGATPQCPRSLDEYALLGDVCQAADFDCPGYFYDECGCGCAPDAECLPDDAYVALGDRCEVVDFVCDDGEFFRDACGCGCIADAGETSQCPVPEGTRLDVASGDVSLIECFGAGLSSQTLRSQDEYDLVLGPCGLGGGASDVDFETQMVFVAVVQERISVRLGYVVEQEGTLLVGVEADAYCGGARPPDAALLVTLPVSETDPIQETCHVGMCSGLPVP